MLFGLGVVLCCAGLVILMLSRNSSLHSLTKYIGGPPVLLTVTRKFPVSSNGWKERLKHNFYSLGYYCTPNLSIHQNSTQELTWNFLVTLVLLPKMVSFGRALKQHIVSTTEHVAIFFLVHQARCTTIMEQCTNIFQLGACPICSKHGATLLYSAFHGQMVYWATSLFFWYLKK